MPVGKARLTLRKENQVLKILAFPPEISSSFWKQYEKNQDFVPITSARFPLFSFPCQTPSSDAFLPETALYQPVTQTSSAFTGSFNRTQQPSCCPRWGNVFSQQQQSVKFVVGEAIPWLTSMPFPGDAGDRGGTLNWTEISQHRKESKSCYIVWVAKHGSFLNVEHAFLPLKSDYLLNQTKKKIPGEIKVGQLSWNEDSYEGHELTSPLSLPVLVPGTRLRKEAGESLYPIRSCPLRTALGTEQGCSAAKSHLKNPQPHKSDEKSRFSCGKLLK